MAHIHSVLPLQSVGEEFANTATHAIGFGLAIAGFIYLLTLALALDGIWPTIGCGIYGVTLLLTYGGSTIYHSVQIPHIKRWLRVCDHAAIYLLIAGTYTPFTFIALRDSIGWTLFCIIWCLGIIGAVYKFLFFGHYNRLTMALYLIMGGLIFLFAGPLVESLPFESFLWLVAGAVFYTSGLFFFVQDYRRYFHAIWHLFVLAGSAAHYMAILLCIKH